VSEVTVAAGVVEGTLTELREGGAEGCERLVLWLGRRRAGGFNVTAGLVPPQECERDRFFVAPSGMTAVFDELRRERLMIVAQVHSHPGDAFHSEADDELAMVRHEGAFSIVVPRFARGVSVPSFLRDAAVFRLSADNIWEPLSNLQAHQALEVRNEP
jgi:proteasome lid subunit RPN8/RPN11